MTNAYALISHEARGVLFVGVNVKTYPGMVVGEHNREQDLEVNPVKGKQLNNVRAAGKEETIRLTPFKNLSLEEIIAYVQGIFIHSLLLVEGDVV